MHVDEISHEAARAKIEAALISTIAAMFLLIPHQTAPLCCTLEALLPTPREAVCSLESSIARQNKEKKMILAGKKIADRKARLHGSSRSAARKIA
jgi:hypothetical protein